MNKRIIFCIMLFVSLLFSRDDPFVPLVVPKDSIRPYYGETSVFDKEEISLPSNARLIKKIEITYQNIDGSIETKSVAVSGKIDWRMPLVVSQILDKPISTNTTLDSKDSSMANVYKIDNNNIFIAYEGKLLRDFIMKNPDRIVLDFDINMKYYKKNKIDINNPYFTSIKYGLHDDFLRIVVELDGSYIYDIKQTQNGVNINVK
ncbi:hypothetical protein CCY99_02520 [Helicobacter sp. 16-1353]|uniref:AMIN domain-containing protein n=1 Tax=Helicobacter sp. 16-1353 TaxID=2004996 RepID=UPI000DCB91DE|nr:AMIN domain-containing protein [Helicobacter sp. 16-1353]RAX54657.1 hypothetical protein CCY99_02520 [Helicobacter sp. 16-1353]